jgi:hypothetical protein
MSDVMRSVGVLCCAAVLGATLLALFRGVT